MEKKGVLTKILAIAGTVLVWFPILAPALFSVVRFIQARRFMFDYLTPAELFPVFLVGAGLLIWAALRAHSRRGIIGWGFGATVGLLVVSAVFAEITGLASGATEEGGWQWALLLALFAGFWLAIIIVGIGGLLLLRDLFKPPLPSRKN
jgi:hypothetical protein